MLQGCVPQFQVTSGLMLQLEGLILRGLFEQSGTAAPALLRCSSPAARQVPAVAAPFPSSGGENCQ